MIQALGLISTKEKFVQSFSTDDVKGIDLGSSNASPEVSCSDCKLELVQKTWTNLLLHWMNRCVNPDLHLKTLTSTCLVEIINRYKEDIVDDDIDRAILCTDDLEPFLRYKYPILRLRYFTEEKDAAKKLYIMTSVLLYHCCICSHTGVVENDICNKLAKEDREMVLKFCESLSDMEITINNVEVAIKTACECMPKAGPSKSKKRFPTPYVSKAAVTEDNLLPETESIAVSDVSSKKMRAKKVSTLTFKASVTVMPSHISANEASYSKTSLQPVSSLETSDTYSLKLDEFSESMTVDSVAVFNTTEKEESQQNYDSRSDKSKNSFASNPIDENKTSKSKRDGKSPAEEILNVNLDSKLERHRHTNEEAVGNKRYSKETAPTADEKNRFKREVCCLPQEQVDTSPSNDSKNDPCNCAVTTSEEIMSDMSAAYGDNFLPDCKACAGTPNLPTPHDAMEEKKFEIGPRVQATFYNLCTLLKGGRTREEKRRILWIVLGVLIALLVIFLIVGAIIYFGTGQNNNELSESSFKDVKQDRSYGLSGRRRFRNGADITYPMWAWQCTNSLCMRVFKPQSHNNTYSSLSRCILLCTGPQLWPHPLGMTYFSKELVALATERLEYKFQAVPSDAVNQHLAEAFKLFLGDLARLERIDIKNKNSTHDIEVKKMHITMEVEADPDPRIRVHTDESYYLKIIGVDDKINININSPSFAGVRHGLETLSQVILLDQSTGYLITLSEVIVKDAPSYKYRGLMLDTARNYIPVHDILRTIDGMATCKLNTFHWRITDSASFPLLLPSLSNLFEYGAYDRAMVYTKQDVKAVVNRAAVRGIRVLIEVAIPGPVGRAWSWSDDATCPKKNDNFTCENVICLRLRMEHRVFELLQHLYSEIIDMTGVDDIFHMSDGVFSLSHCYYLIDEREGFLEKALERLRRANKGFLPKLPIVWYTQHLHRETDARVWERYGVQVYEWPSRPDRSLSRYKVIHSGRWDLSCDVKKQRCTKYRSWQEMYGWKSWRNIEVFTVEGGEALLWTDLVDSGNLDFHLWPRAAAVAERLWSDLVANATASGDVYIRLDNHRWRMLLRGLQVQPIWPVWCSFNPASCLSKLHAHRHK